MTDQEIDWLNRNPFVGPRPIRTGEQFPARRVEVLQLAQRIVSSKVVLLHAPSGAGKTSLIQAAVLPEFRRRGFHLGVHMKSEDDLAPLRVNVVPPSTIAIDNRYVYSAVHTLIGHLVKPSDLRKFTLSGALDLLRNSTDSSGVANQLVVFDQLEEVLTLDPTDRDGQTEFFNQLGEALEDPSRWALLSMREDFMGGLDRYLPLIPGRLRSRFRLDFLEVAAAKEAITGPAAQQSVTFGEKARDALIDDLRRVTVEDSETALGSRRSPYVQPMLLQVACHNVWRKKCKTAHGKFTNITLDDVAESGNVENALRRYYNDVMAGLKLTRISDERELRDWVESALITADGHRTQTSTRPRMRDSPSALASLRDRYLIRDDVRDGTQWWELSHDRLIPAAYRANALWRRDNLEAWQIDALKWERTQRTDSSYLLTKVMYPQARKAVARLGEDATALDREFVEISARYLADRGRLQRSIVGLQFATVFLVLSLILNAVLLYFVLAGIW